MSRFFLIFLALALSSFEALAATKNNIYLVENIQTKATAKTVIAARNNALNNARRDGLAILLSRLNIPLSTIENLSNEEIADMARSEQIVDEKIAGVSYSAKINIVFAKSFVDHILGQKTESKNSTTRRVFTKNAENALLIPVLRKDSKNFVWEDENIWRYFLKSALKKDDNQKFIIPEGKIDDISDINSQNILNIGFGNIENMISRYNAQMAYLLAFSYDNDLNKAVVEVTTLRQFQKQTHRLAFYNKDNLDQDSLKKAVANKTIAYLSGAISGQEKITTRIDYDDAWKPKNETFIKVKVNNIDDFIRLKNVVENSNLAENLNFLSISRDNIVISLSYVGSNDVASSFLPYGLQLYPDQKNSYNGNLL